jgi:hypothetical protein
VKTSEKRDGFFEQTTWRFLRRYVLFELRDNYYVKTGDFCT